MKGTIIDFDETEKVGLILSEDGNRYEFDLSQWKSKNKTPELDNEVDFVINEDKVCDIYSLNKVNDANKTKNNNDLQNHFDSDIKKINFTEIENTIDAKLDAEVYNPEVRKKGKQMAIKYFLISLVVLVFEMILITLSNEAKWYLLSIILGFIFFITILVSITVIMPVVLPDKLLRIIMNIQRKKDILEEYKKHLKIINYTPNNLYFDNLEIINVRESTLEEAENKLLKKAYELKADAIINYSNQFNTISSVNTSGFGSAKTISTSVKAVNTLSGLAIKVKG